MLEAPDARGARRRRRCTRRLADPRHPGRRRRAARRLRRRPARRDGYVSLEVSPLLAHDTAGDARRGAAPVAGGRPRQPDDQSPRDPAGHPRHRAADRRGHQRQRHAALRAETPTSRWPRPTSRAWRRFVARGGDPRAASPAWPASSSAASTPRSTRSSTHALQDRPTRASRACCAALTGKVAIANAKLAYQRYQETLQRPALAGAGRARRADAAPAVGQHRHEESQLSRRRSTSRS